MPTRSVRVALLQLNPTVGDLSANAERIIQALRTAEGQGAQIAVTPELCLTGYPPEDLLLRPAFLRAARQTLDRIAAQTRDTVLVCGYPELVTEAGSRPAVSGSLPAARLRNSAAILHRGRALAGYRKIALPNYGVFDERRYFAPGDRPTVIELRPGRGADRTARPRSVRAAISICEDLWPEAGGAYLNTVQGSGIDLLINLSASPFDRAKFPVRLEAMRRAARQTQAHLIHVNLVGGQDELIFDGRSFVLDPKGRALAQGKAFQEDCLIVDVPVGSGGPDPLSPASSKPSTPARQSLLPGSDEETLAAIELSLRDYVNKNGFASVGVAMSGGIDSALVAAIAVRALGAARVTGVTLPSRITSRQTLQDAVSQAKAMGIRFHQIAIAPLVSGFLKALAPSVRGTSGGAMEENLQARVRGTLMMALSNRMGFLLLATGNKSELATGYCTLYGDMAGGFAPLKDLSKAWVYRLARCVNRLEGRPMIPLSVIRRAPSAELKPGQKDQDTLPPYPELDAILEGLIEKDEDGDALIRRGRKAKWVQDTARRVYANEYKRRQAPVGPKVTPRAFGRDRRMPITQKGGPAF
jgi:NAD+ synthase (glutamine-hydrolysing)